MASVAFAGCEGCEVPATPGQEPACTFTCPEGQVLTCSEVCVTPVPNDGSCSIVDCTQSSVCASGLGCVPADSGHQCVGTQAEGGLGILSECDPDEFDLCPADTFCRDDRVCFPDSLRTGLCSRGATNGAKCDSEWDDPGCSPCIRGLACIKKHTQDPFGFCHKRCASVGDCPCPDTLHELGCVQLPEDKSGQNWCYECRHMDEQCDQERRCCDSGTHCSVDGTCCVDEGTDCESSAECCQADEQICLAGTCRPCIGWGKTGCTKDSDCCGSKICSSSGMCVKPCPAGEECKVGKLKGPCNDAVFVCDAKGQGSCPQKTFASPEKCDEIDNDCNGKVDDLAPETCEQQPPTCATDFKVKGVFVCKDGEKKCDIEGRFCGNVKGAVACGGVTVDGQYCGACAGHECVKDKQECMPKAVCQGAPNNIICLYNPLCPQMTCWLPKDVGSCKLW
ncbi:MAG: hypothetical protein HY744_29340 [Deltaproteobacteria bacterium]|nr:hypothetical protein [Deltaproteobacteria bacterium]